MPYIKNIDQEKIFNLKDQIEIQDQQIISKTLVQNSAVSMTLFAFAKNEEISTHESTGDAMVTVLEGLGEFTVDAKKYILNAGDTLIMPAKKPHAIFAPENFKWLLTVVFP